MKEVKELESEIPEFNPETHKWDWKLKKVVELTPEELAEIARQKRKADLEKRFQPLVANNVYYQKAFGVRVKEINGEKHAIHKSDEIAQWDRDNLDDFEQKVLKLEAAKKEMDNKEEQERPMLNRKNEYRKRVRKELPYDSSWPTFPACRGGRSDFCIHQTANHGAQLLKCSKTVKHIRDQPFGVEDLNWRVLK